MLLLVTDWFQINGKGVDGDGKLEVEKNTFKPFPCGIVIHPAIDGCAQLRLEGLRPENVQSIDLSVHPLVVELTGKKYPKDGLQAKFSVYHGAACGLLFGKATPDEYTDEVVKQTADLREKTTATVDKAMRADECHIVIKTTDGSILERHVDHAVGSLTNPMKDERFLEKFMDQVTPVLGEGRSAALFAALQGINDIPDSRMLFSTN